MGSTGFSHRALDRGAGICLFSVAVGLCVIHFVLPTSVRADLVFQYGNPTPLTAWSAVLIHDSVEHLASNLLGYLLVIVPTYTLYQMWDRRRQFWLLLIGVASIVPPLVTAVDYWLLYLRWSLAGPETVGFGFSGVVSGLVGVLFASTVVAVVDWYGWGVAAYTIAVVVGGSTAGVLVTTGRPFVQRHPVILVVGFGIIALFGLATRWQSWEGLYNRHRRNHNQLYLIVACVVIACVLGTALFQVEINENGRFIDIIAHATGLLVGIGLTMSGSILAEN